MAMTVALASVTAVNAADCELYLSIFPITQGESVPDGAADALYTRMQNALTTTGVVASTDYSQFILTAKFNHITEDVVAGPPMMTAFVTDLTLYIGNQVTEQVFASQTITLRGVGKSQERAYKNAMQQLSGKNRELTTFIDKGRKKIIAWYDSNYRQILADAQKAAGTHNYEQALYLATSIPTCCAGYDEAYNATLKYFQEYINWEGDKEYRAALAAWSVDPTATGAEEAFTHLLAIDPSSAAYAKGMKLADEMKKQVKSDRDFEYRQKYNDQIDLERRRIEAARAVGVAWGNGQKPTTTNIAWIR